MLGDNIKQYRKKYQLSQDELAEKLGVTRQSISLWETGQTQPSLENIVALAKLFQISTDTLLIGGEDEPTGVREPADEEGKKMNKKYILPLSIGLGVIVGLLISLLPWMIGSSDTDDPNANTNMIVGATAETTSPKETDVQRKPVTGKELYDYLKAFAVENGTINGDYSAYSKSADHYGGNASEAFSLYYWGDTDTVEFCLHHVVDDTYSINFYLYVPQNHTGTYEYVSSYYYRDSGISLYEARGTLEADKFTSNYPLTCTKYIGSTDHQNEFMEGSRQGVCDLLDCLAEFITVEGLEYSFSDFGFTAF